MKVKRNMNGPVYIDRLCLPYSLTEKLVLHRIEYLSDLMACTKDELKETANLTEQELKVVSEKMGEFKLEFWIPAH